MSKNEKSKQSSNNDHNLTSDKEDNYRDPEAVCGIGRFKPAALQVCANMAVFTGVYSFNGLFSSTLSSYIGSQVTTLERHFGFNSSQTGLIMAANDIGFLAVILIVSYIAAKVHIPRALGLVSILFGISGILCALPQFLYGGTTPVSSGNTTSAKLSKSISGQICDGINDTLPGCNTDLNMTELMKMAGDQEEGPSARSSSNAALTIIVLGMVLQGVAKTPRSSFVTTYVDANVEKVKTGFYMGIIISISIVGPAMAYALGSLFTRIYVTLEKTDMDFKHPHWVGAWWLGYIVFGCGACVVSIPLFFFPRRLRRPDLSEKQHKEDSKASHKGMSPKMVFIFIKGFASAILRLLLNPIYMCMVTSSCVNVFAMAGVGSFGPKYIENQFSFPAWKANIVIAAITLSTACLGTFLGGVLSRRLKMGPLTSLKFVVVMQAITFILNAIKIFIKCDQPYLYNSPGPRASAETTILGCHDACACDDNDYFPVCGDDGRSFFSPCHAGCMQSLGRSYMNCSCITGGTAVAGMCDYNCAMSSVFFILTCLSALFGTFAIVPHIIIYIRAVEDRDKPLALGFNSFMSSLTGWMLGPIIFGWIIDGICIQWQDNCTGGGACRLYDNDVLRVKMYGYQTGFRLVGFFFFCTALFVAIKTKKFESKEAINTSKEVSLSLINGNSKEVKVTEKIDAVV